MSGHQHRGEEHFRVVAIDVDRRVRVQHEDVLPVGRQEDAAGSLLPDAAWSEPLAQLDAALLRARVRFKKHHRAFFVGQRDEDAAIDQQRFATAGGRQALEPARHTGERLAGQQTQAIGRCDQDRFRHALALGRHAHRQRLRVDADARRPENLALGFR